MNINKLMNEEHQYDMSPSYEGSNICSWIGFKHVMYLLEEGLLKAFSDCDMSKCMLFEKHGICLEVLDTKARILHALHMGDNVSVNVKFQEIDANRSWVFSTKVFVERKGKTLKSVVGKLKVKFRKYEASAPVPSFFDQYLSDGAYSFTGDSQLEHASVLNGRGEIDPSDPILEQLPASNNQVVWKWHIPYFYCHFTDRIQMSGYLRLMEEVEDLFLAKRGISIYKMLKNKKWIPVVPNANVTILQEAYMEEPLYTVFSIDSVFQDSIYTATMDCYVKRGQTLVKVATGEITHGYAVIEDNRHDWSLVNFDEHTLAAIKNKELVVAG